ncbi:MAG: ribosome-associated translation inhibitor RaiA [Oscillospiraceae bacterium]|nr:ribosome-associated translation inhibitor RaiA [Oscillospiraceae bacterium]MCI8878647.1 ribosome-associated translation inhibitor RaiA [Oscillospiraceae bacterium]
MKFTFTCKKVSLNDSIKEYTEKKVSKLDRYFREDAEAIVIFSVEKDHRCVVEITIRSGGTIFRAQEETRDGDMRSAVDAACSTIIRQIRKNKTRLSKRLRQDAPIAEAESAAAEVSEEKDFDVVRTKHVAVKPMSEEEAILQMNLLGHDFFVFRNTDDVISIAYRRKNGGYGLLETDGTDEE